MKYFFDTNIFIRLMKDYPSDVFVSLWTEIEENIKEGNIISSIAVYHELESKADEVLDWAKRIKPYLFKSYDNNIVIK